MKTVRVVISGRVQGIGFRKWMKRQAKKLAVVGWVKNREDGAVESVVQGDTDSLRQLITLLHIGPPLSHIEGVLEDEIVAVSQYDDFIVVQ